MCGEHNDMSVAVFASPGSSPHVRGARDAVAVAAHVVGIIPACAGSTMYAIIIPPYLRDHPRMCGEHVPPPSKPELARGSSPHVRGARKDRSVRVRRLGIIPACAGSTAMHAGKR